MGSLNTDLFYAIVAAAVTTFLGLLVFIHERKSASNKIFILHSLIGSIWALVNYKSIVADENTLLLWIRLVMFFAVPYVALFFLFVSNFPNSRFVYKSKEWFWYLVLVFILMGLTLTPYVFRSLSIDPIDGHAIPVPGVLIPFFGISLVTFFLISLFIVIKRYRLAEQSVKGQWLSIGIGLGTAYTLLIVFVFLHVVVLNDITYVRYSALFILPIFVGISYAILKHRLFSVKVITTELISFTLLLVSFINILVTTTSFGRILAVLATIFTLITSILLIRSVLKEVKQREELEVLSKQLAEANEQLKALDKARAEFISIASHQLRTPPATIKWYVGAILNGDFGPLSEELKAALLRTNVTNEAQISTIDDLLNASRIERGKLEFFFEMGNIAPMLKTLVEQLEPLAQMKKQHLVYTPPTTPIPDILVDNEKVRQVINNMVDNAIKYSKKGDIHISLELDSATDPQNVVVKVKDTGKGIEPSEIEGLFQKYSRGKDSATHATGLGLGMYVAKVIIEQHNGKIWAESEGIGKGATFAFSLPIHSKIQPTSTVDLTKSLG